MFRFISLVLSFTSELFNGRPLYSVPEGTLSQQVFKTDVANNWDLVEPLDAAPPLNGIRIGSRKSWIVTCDSELDKDHDCSKLVDGNSETYWLTSRKSSSQPNTVIVDLGESRDVNGIAVLPRQDLSKEGNIAAHEIYLSDDARSWDTPVAYGTWWTDRTEKYSSFETQSARYVRLVAISDAMLTSWTGIAELNVYIDPSFTGRSSAKGVGKWGPTLNTPIVPVSAFLDPYSGKVMLLSSKRHDSFPQDQPAWTITAIWDPISRAITQAKVENTKHNMFCPGMSFDAHGRMIVTGGASGKKTTIFDGRVDDPGFHKQWQKAAEMNIVRGYHSAVLIPDGRMFVLGGSWGAKAFEDPTTRIKNGEVFNPNLNTWTSLPQCRAEPLWTKDHAIEKRDNHLWLFAWKNNTVFQAGPSKNMNWYTVDNDQGGWKAAGTRTPSDGIIDADAMCGEAVMYDAVAGRIVTFGGANSYEKGGPSSNSAFFLTLGEPNSTVEVKRAESMSHNRTFASAIVVPNGDVFVSGGQFGIPEVFVDTNPVLQAEMFSPTTGTWKPLANNSIVRVYHSFTLLLQDATILNGGGGLCGDSCKANHFDAQIYIPPYLLTSDGQMARRPAITKMSSHEAKPGDSITITTDSEISSASLIRYSSTTHAVNTDQRRIPLKVSKVGDNEYKLSIPSESYVAIPGFWMLFVLNDQEVPSVAETIRILTE